MTTPATALRLGRRTVAALIVTVVVVLAAGCGKVEADRGQIAQHLGDAYGAYLTYVAEPAQAGKLGPSTAPTDPVAKQAAVAAKYVVLSVEAARTEAAPDAKLASFAQKTAAAGASLNAVSTVVSTGKPTQAFIAGGTASLESLLAAGRDLGLKIDRSEITPEQLKDPPAA
ncbi:MAG: hypothetical protein J7513_12615 [Solirubrobacteraceae bacterium]|nr:hypothetical protein [Solirubrobacteraceae bacterium]